MLVAITEAAGAIRGASSVWFIDNVAALMTLVKGSSGSRSLNQIAKITHLACFAVRSVPYFEYVESKANWAGGLSRVGAQGNWASHNAFSVSEAVESSRVCAHGFAVASMPYFDYVELTASWADEISRVGAQGNWASLNTFSMSECGVAVKLLTLPSLAIVRIFESL